MATSKNTKMAHIINLMSIAGIDGNISEEEKNVIIKIAQDMGLTAYPRQRVREHP